MWYSCQIVDGINTRGSCRTVRIRSTHKQTDRVKSAYPTLFLLLQLCCTGLKIKVPNQKVTCYKITCLAHLWVNLMHHTWRTMSLLVTHWSRDKMATISQTTLSNAFSWISLLEFRLKLHWSVSPRVKSTISQHWFRKWFGPYQTTSHDLNQWWWYYLRIYLCRLVARIVRNHTRTTAATILLASLTEMC